MGFRANLIRISTATCILHGFLVFLFAWECFLRFSTLAGITTTGVLIIYILIFTDTILARRKSREYSYRFLRWAFTSAFILILISFGEYIKIRGLDFFTPFLLLLPLCLMTTLLWLNKDFSDSDMTEEQMYQ